jgi:hypothetical protein
MPNERVRSRGFLFIRRVRKGALTSVCKPFRNGADGQKAKQDRALILHRAQTPDQSSERNSLP